MQKNKKGIVWFKNNLRITDNVALTQAVLENDLVVACYCFEPSDFEITTFGFRKTGPFRAQFLIESVQNLSDNLANIGISLFVYQESAATILPQLVASNAHNTVYFQNEWTSEESALIDRIKSNCGSEVRFNGQDSQFLIPPQHLPFTPNEIPDVFTRFRLACEKNLQIPMEVSLVSMPFSNLQPNKTVIPTLEMIGFEPIKTDIRTDFPFKGGEEQALSRVNDYLWKTQNIKNYKQTRNELLGTEYSSKFSPWLANGCLSPRTIYWAIKRFENEVIANESTYWLIFELLWRDFFKYVSLKNGNAIFRLNGINHTDFYFKKEESLIQNWVSGTTNEPFVNACMHELASTGWMSNRGRQNTASYFAKELQQDWRIGAAYFEAMLLDYDVHSNYGNWMYLAGVGNDTRNRKFTISLQTQLYDAEAAYQKKWNEPKLEYNECY